MGEGSVPTGEKVSKAQVLSNAIEGFGRIGMLLRHLISQVEGEILPPNVMVDEKAGKVKLLGLNELLTQGPGRIVDYEKEAEGMIAQLKELLF